MKNLKEEIQRSKQLMGITEGINLPKQTPLGFAISLISDLIYLVQNPDQQDNRFIGYYDKNGILVADENVGGKYDKGSFSISFERIYLPICRKFPDLLYNYDTISPIIEQALEKILKKDIGCIHNVSNIETFWRRSNN